MPRVAFTDPKITAQRRAPRGEPNPVGSRARELRCWACDAPAKPAYRWDDGLTYAGSLCEQHARAQAEVVDQMNRSLVELWEAFALVDPRAKGEAERRRAAYETERTLPPEKWDHLREPVQRIPRDVHERFLAFQESRA